MSVGVMLDSQRVALFVRRLLEGRPEPVSHLDGLGHLAGIAEAMPPVQVVPEQGEVLVRQLDTHSTHRTVNGCSMGGFAPPPRIFCRRHHG
jgi:hypothetical protein